MVAEGLGESSLLRVVLCEHGYKNKKNNIVSRVGTPSHCKNLIFLYKQNVVPHDVWGSSG